MPRDGDGIYVRKDRPGYYITFKDADGRRRRRKVDAPNNELAKLARSGEQIRAEQTRAMGFAPPTDVLFADVAQQYLTHQRTRRRNHEALSQVALLVVGYLRRRLSGLRGNPPPGQGVLHVRRKAK